MTLNEIPTAVRVRGISMFRFPPSLEVPRETTITIIIDQEGGLWFVAKEVCEVLGYSSTSHAKKIFPNTELLKTAGLGFAPRGILIIPELDLFNFIMQSKKPAAKKLCEWFTEEILPQIYGTEDYAGLNILEDTVDQRYVDLDNTTAFTECHLAHLEMRAAQLEVTVSDEFHDMTAAADGSSTLSEAAWNLGLGRNTWIAILRDKGYLYKRAGKHLPVQKYLDMGLFEVSKRVSDVGCVLKETRITAKGMRHFAREFGSLKQSDSASSPARLVSMRRQAPAPLSNGRTEIQCTVKADSRTGFRMVNSYARSLWNLQGISLVKIRAYSLPLPSPEDTKDLEETYFLGWIWEPPPGSQYRIEYQEFDEVLDDEDEEEEEWV